jgi:hypothetical protein
METKVKSAFWLKIFAGIWVAFGLAACQFEGSSDYDFSSGEGSGGSLARFTIANSHLYTVDNTSLKVFDLSNPQKPLFKTSKEVGFGVETIFPLGKKLFLGTQTGMYIYDVSSPTRPTELSFYEHIFSCDPVVSDGNFAYVTLSSANQTCWREINELQIVDIRNLENPQLVKRYNMQGPRGLAIRNDTLWVCDAGLKVYDVSDKANIRLIHHFNSVVAYDIILNKQLAMVVGENGFVQYRIANDTIFKISEINIE